MRPYSEMIDYLKDKKFPVVKNNKKVEYVNIEAGFDIETTSYKQGETKTAFMYVWMIAIEYEGDTFYGRTWDEFVDLCSQLQEHFELSDEKRLVVYVHNLEYEFQFIRKYFNWTDVFSNNERKPMKALTDLGIEFRDSYVLSGYSLANTAKNLAKHKITKMEGDLDYSLVRHHETPLTDDEIGYCVNDVQIILAYINEQIEHCGDVSKIPMTNTGRVRKYVRDACYKGKKAGRARRSQAYREKMNVLSLDNDTYSMLKRAFMGGFTHGNALYTGEVLTDVSSIDFTSSYPSVMLSEKFPMSRFQDVEITSIDELEFNMKKYAVLINVVFRDIEAQISQDSYLSESKCTNLFEPVINNGRIYKATTLETTITDVDFTIMQKVYKWSGIHIKSAKIARKDYLPKAICESILSLYQDKTQLKGVEGSEVEYMLSKGMLNSVYGMCVQDVVKNQATYDNNGLWSSELPDTEQTIKEHNESRNRFLFYGWGVWITAYARKNLWSGILSVGDDYVYSDTDSLKVRNYESHLTYINNFDEQITNKMKLMCDYYKLDKKLLSPKTKDGVKKPLGVWDFEGSYKKFKALGAKRYLYENENGFDIEIEDDEIVLDMEITIAGLSKQNGLKYMLEVCENDSDKVFEMFDDELFIPSDRTGKMTFLYIDNEHSLTVTDYTGIETTIKTLSGTYLEPCSFTLDQSEQYQEYMRMARSGYTFTGVDYV